MNILIRVSKTALKSPYILMVILITLITVPLSFTTTIYAKPNDLDSSSSNEKALLSSPEDGDTITKDDFNGKLKISWDKGSNVDKYVLEIKGTGNNSSGTDESAEDSTASSILTPIIGLFTSRNFTKTLSASTDNYELALNNFPKSKTVKITLKTYFNDYEDENDYESDSITVKNQATSQVANRKMIITSPEMLDEVTSAPTIKFDSGQNVKSAELKVISTFSTTSIYSTKIEDPETASIKIPTENWDKAPMFVTIQLTSKFESGRTSTDSILIINKTKNGNYDPVTIESPENQDEVSEDDFPLRFKIENSDQDDISNVKVSLYAFNLDQSDGSGITKLNGEVNTVKAFKTFSLSKNDRESKEFTIEPDDWDFDEKYITVLIKTKFKDGSTKDSFITLQNVDSGSGDDNNGDNEYSKITSPTTNKKISSSPITIKWDYGSDTISGYKIAVYTTSKKASTTTCNEYNSDENEETDCSFSGNAAVTINNIDKDERSYSLSSSKYSLPANKIVVIRLYSEFDNGDENYDEVYIKSKTNSDGGDDNSGDIDTEKAKSKLTSPSDNLIVKKLPLKVKWSKPTETVDNFKLEVFYTDISADKSCKPYKNSSKSNSSRIDCSPDGSADKTIDNIVSNDRMYELTSSKISLKNNKIIAIRLTTKFANGDSAYDETYIKSKPDSTNATGAVINSYASVNLNNNSKPVIALADTVGVTKATFKKPKNGASFKHYPIKFTWNAPVNAKTVTFRAYRGKTTCTTIECAESKKSEFTQNLTSQNISFTKTSYIVDEEDLDMRGYFNDLFSIETKCIDGSSCGVDWIFVKTKPNSGVGSDTSTYVQPSIYSPADNSVNIKVPTVSWTSGKNIKKFIVQATITKGSIYDSNGKKVSSLTKEFELNKDTVNYNLQKLINDCMLSRNEDHSITFKLTTFFTNERQKSQSIKFNLLKDPTIAT